MPDDFTRQWRAFGWERINKLWSVADTFVTMLK